MTSFTLTPEHCGRVAAERGSLFMIELYGEADAGGILRGYLQGYAAHLSCIMGAEECAAFLDRLSCSIFAEGQVLESSILEAAERGSK